MQVDIRKKERGNAFPVVKLSELSREELLALREQYFCGDQTGADVDRA